MVDELTEPSDISQVRSHYDSKVDEYDRMYFSDRDDYVPALVAEEILLKRILDLDADRVLDMGCGNGGMVHTLCKNGIDAVGFDLSEEMITSGKTVFESDGLDPERLKRANVQDGIPFDGTFDVIMGVGLFPHLDETAAYLRIVCNSLRSDGVALIQFRNALFNLYSMNSYTYHYIMESILTDANLPVDLHSAFDQRLRDICRVGEEGIGQTPETDSEGQFHNPLTIHSTFNESGFDVDEIYFYHYHPIPPEFRAVDEAAYDQLAKEFEDPHDWRGYFMASSFIIEAN
ncbi:class I SAM-dependent methyltransferase [Halopenitus sp. POP-27]|uniref:SAM-dependent methyltransferase n=1 Tax=Halopenitus sp. POP-27 TaxID=2994425 RepID=UPI002468E54C|nr:class I SAM-dependent methyltransferase [Halopenitus sp. POP-27]